MKRVQLIHWKPTEAEVRVGELEAAGYEVTYETFQGPPTLRRLRAEPPDAVVIDLRSPSEFAEDHVPGQPWLKKEVLELLAGGKTNRDIGAALFISESTVKFHVHAILSKLDASNRTEAVSMAMQQGVISLPSAG